MCAQWVTGYKIDANHLTRSLRRVLYQRRQAGNSNEELLVGNFSYTDKPLRLGDLFGNRFHMYNPAS